MKELKDLKAGDLVILTYKKWTSKREYVAKIERITPKGFIKVNGMLFYSDGRPRGDHTYRIESATDEKIESIRQEEFIIKILKKIQRIEDLTYEQAAEIHNLLKKWGLSDDG